MKTITIEVHDDGNINIDYDMPQHEYFGILNTLLAHANMRNLKPFVIQIVSEILTEIEQKQEKEKLEGRTAIESAESA